MIPVTVAIPPATVTPRFSLKSILENSPRITLSFLNSILPIPAATVPPPLTTEVVREIRTRPAPSGSPNVSPLPKLSSFAIPFLGSEYP